MLGDRLEYFMDELAAGAIFPNLPAEPTTISHGVIFLIENSFINNLDVSSAYETPRHETSLILKSVTFW